MQMTKGEIVRSYNEAKNPQSQIGILAELNACSKEYIEEIIEEATTQPEIPELPVAQKRRGRKPKAVLQGEDQPEKIKEEPDEEIKEWLEESPDKCRVPTECLGSPPHDKNIDHVMHMLQEEMERVDEQIRALEKRYKDIVTAMQVVGSLNN